VITACMPEMSYGVSDLSGTVGRLSRRAVSLSGAEPAKMLSEPVCFQHLELYRP
jgi:hypothetical protein